MAKVQCALHHRVSVPNGTGTNGGTNYSLEDSRLYDDLVKKMTGDRPLANYIYANYEASDMGDKMVEAGIPRNSQEQHNMKDVLDYINWDNILSEIGTLPTIELEKGFVDTNGVRVPFTNAKEALEKANEFNDNHKWLIASVSKHGDVYNIYVNEKNSRTHTFADTVKEHLKIWEVYEEVFRDKGIDINNIPEDLKGRINALNPDLAVHLKNISMMPIGNLYRIDALELFSLSPDTPKVRAAINTFGSIENAAQAVDDFSRNTRVFTTHQKVVLREAVAEAKRFNGINLDALIERVKNLSKDLQDMSPEKPIKEELYRLNKLYNIEKDEIHRTSKDIDSLSEAAAEAAIILERKIRLLEKERGTNTEGKRLEDILNNLMKELYAKRYYSGLLKFLDEAVTCINGDSTKGIKGIDDLILEIPQTGTEIEKAFATAKVLQQIKSIKDQFYPLAKALSDERLKMDDTISQVDIDNLRSEAEKVMGFFEAKDEVIKKLAESSMITILSKTIGNEMPNGQSVINAVRMAATDSTIWDYLYSVGRASNPIIASMGSIIRNAQDNRSDKMNDLSHRIDRSTNKLYKAGFTSDFMYEDDGHIVSDIDWHLYNSTRTSKIKALRAQGLRDLDLKQAIEDWEDMNTEERVVDITNGRTERIPNQVYRKSTNFQEGWSKEQKDYYNEMMQIKGEIGSLLPAWAQHQYLPPQVRRNMLDALGRSKSIQDVSKAIRTKLANLYKVREDDENYNKNGIIDGDEYAVTEGDFSNKPLREIPIFFVNKVEQGELLKDFSAGITALAGTALNYEAMHEIVDVVEFMKDFATSQPARENTNKADVVENKQLRVVKDLWKRGQNTNTSAIMEGFIAQEVYGQRRSEMDQKHKKLTKFFDNVIAYTSFKGLATNIKGAFANYTMGEFQMLVEAGAGEFYGIKDYAWAHSKLFGSAGVGGEIAELLTNNINHKSVRMREIFDPLQENFSDKSHKRYYKSMFRQIMSHDCSFIGYASGEYLIHYVNMYSILHKQKVLLDGKKISLYDAFEMEEKKDGNTELRLKQGVTDLDGKAITPEYIDKIRKRIRYVNQTTHGSMNSEDKGILHQYLLGRAVMNFRQWMVEHYSRRFRGRHFDASLGENREGYWISLYKFLSNDDTKDTWKRGDKGKAIGMFMHDMTTFLLRQQANWNNLDDMQKYNLKRASSELYMFIALLGLSFALGEPDEHKKEFWRRWWIYQTNRMLLDTEASMPIPQAVTSMVTIAQSPMPAVNTMSSLFYMFFGLFNGDLTEEIKSGKHKGENKYWRNVKKYDFPFFKDYEQMQNMDTDDAIFKIFDTSPSNH